MRNFKEIKLNLKKLLKVKKEIFILIIILIITYYVPIKFILIVKLVLFLVLIWVLYKIKSLEQKNDGIASYKTKLILFVLFEAFLGFMLSEAGGRSVEEKLNNEIKWRTLYSEILLIEKGITDGRLEVAWEKPDDTIYDENNYKNANADYKSGNFKEAIDKYKVSLKTVEVLSEIEINKLYYLADIYYRIGWSFYRSLDKEQALKNFAKSMKYSTKYRKKYPKVNGFKGYIAAYMMSSKIYANKGKYDKAKDMIETAGDIWWYDSPTYQLDVLWHKILLETKSTD